MFKKLFEKISGGRQINLPDDIAGYELPDAAYRLLEMDFGVNESADEDDYIRFCHNIICLLSFGKGYFKVVHDRFDIWKFSNLRSKNAVDEIFMFYAFYAEYAHAYKVACGENITASAHMSATTVAAGFSRMNEYKLKLLKNIKKKKCDRRVRELVAEYAELEMTLRQWGTDYSICTPHSAEEIITEVDDPAVRANLNLQDYCKGNWCYMFVYEKGKFDRPVFVVSIPKNAVMFPKKLMPMAMFSRDGNYSPYLFHAIVKAWKSAKHKELKRIFRN